MAILSSLDSKKAYLENLTTAISIMRQELDLTDVDLEVEGQLLPAHRLVLSGASSYFHAMFKGGMKEATSRKVKLLGVSFATMAVILNYIYTGDLNVEDDPDSLMSVLSAAHLLQLQSLYEQCFQLLIQEARLKDCFAELWHLADLYDESKRNEQIFEYIRSNFSNLTYHSQFQQLTLKQMESLVESSLHCSTDHTVHAILLWVTYDRVQRQDHLVHLLSSVHLQSLTREYLRKLQEHDLIKERSDVLLLLLNAASGLLTDLCCTPQRMVICFGKDVNRKSFIGVYSEDEKKWDTKLSPIPITLGVCIAFYQGYIYFIGGGDTAKECTNTVYRYCLKTKSAKAIRKLSISKLNAGSAAFRDKLYIVGGQTATNTLRDAEVYDAGSNTWQPIAPTNKKHNIPQVIGTEDHLYVVCSYKSGVVEQYDVVANQWTLLQSIPFINQSFYPKVTVLRNKLHIIQEKRTVAYTCTIPHGMHGKRIPLVKNSM